jgi:hypothetical protein
MAYIAIAVIAASAAVISNEVYIGFCSPIFIGRDFNLSGKGYEIRLEKNFRNYNEEEVSSIEYGLRTYTFNNTEEYFNGYNYDQYYYLSSEGEFFLNYKYNFYRQNHSNNLRPDNGFVLYTGPSIIFSDNIDFGLNFGSYYQFHPRLKLELGTDINMRRIIYQLGLSYTYQYKMFWNKE